jgi:hypothetical protein
MMTYTTPAATPPIVNVLDLYKAASTRGYVVLAVIYNSPTAYRAEEERRDANEEKNTKTPEKENIAKKEETPEKEDIAKKEEILTEENVAKEQDVIKS